MQIPRCNSHLNKTCAGLLPQASATSLISGSSRGLTVPHDSVLVAPPPNGVCAIQEKLSFSSRQIEKLAHIKIACMHVSMETKVEIEF